MNPLISKNDIVRQLQQEVRSVQRSTGYTGSAHAALGPIEAAFPDGKFPLGVVHEFISKSQEAIAATNGFIATILSCIVEERYILWVGREQLVYPPALVQFGIQPEHVIFVNTMYHTDALWTIEEGLKCGSLAAVVGEIGSLTFMQSRRLQLAVEKSHVTAFIHRLYPKEENTTASVTRWKVAPTYSKAPDGMPGIGHACWDVTLQKVRNGQPGRWKVEWQPDNVKYIATQQIDLVPVAGRKAV
jgi:protein ImuA